MGLLRREQEVHDTTAAWAAAIVVIIDLAVTGPDPLHFGVILLTIKPFVLE